MMHNGANHKPCCATSSCDLALPGGDLQKNQPSSYAPSNGRCVPVLQSLLPKAQLLPLVTDLMERVGSNPPPPAPKYPAASVIQPELRWVDGGCVCTGRPTPSMLAKHVSSSQAAGVPSATDTCTFCLG
jgi:hypothetical protein